MSPTITIQTQDDIERKFSHLMESRECELKTIVQNQCTFDGKQVYCLPFKRTFLKCWQPQDALIGYKLTPGHRVRPMEQAEPGKAAQGRWRHIEITRPEDNVYNLGTQNVDEFLRADEVLRAQMEKYYHSVHSGDANVSVSANADVNDINVEK